MDIRSILKDYKTIAVVGFSDNPERDSNEVTLYMKKMGYRMYGVNPKLGGLTVKGIKCYSSLGDIDFKVDIINVFRRSEFIPGVVDEVLKMKYKPDVIWVQSGITSEKAKEKAEKNGFVYLENKCILIEHKILKNVLY
jgi:hypothetical protein